MGGGTFFARWEVSMAEKKPKATAEIDLGEGYKIVCEASGKQIVVDEPVSFGGTDLGMNPLEVLLSGLGACKCVIAKMLAKKKRLQLDYLSIECTGTFDPEKKVGLSDIETVFHIKSPASDEELEKFMELVDNNCPVNDTIKNSPSLSHRLQRV